MNLQELHQECLYRPNSKEIWLIYADSLIQNDFEGIGLFINYYINKHKNTDEIIKLYIENVLPLSIYTNLFNDEFFSLNQLVHKKTLSLMRQNSVK